MTTARARGGTVPAAQRARPRAAYETGKRIFDVVVSATLLVALAPVMVATAVALLATDGAPVLFRQRRIGRGGRPFVLLKFRTMRVARGSWDPSRDGARLTAAGRVVRRWSLDELPQLWNVLGGSMSLVGPRPLPVEYGPRYSATQFRRHEATPGVTGWAQVNGRNATTWAERFRHDVWYVDNRSFALDLRILAMTARTALRGDGVSNGAAATMPEFMGE